MPKVSDARSVRIGLVGPKPRQKCVGDGQSVNIPIPGQRSEGVTQNGRQAGPLVVPVEGRRELTWPGKSGR
jgi:hypothetical protein